MKFPKPQFRLVYLDFRLGKISLPIATFAKSASQPHSAPSIPHSVIRIPHSPKILYFTRVLPQPGANGAGAYSADILDYLQNHGCEIRVVWTQTPDRFKYEFYNTLSQATARHFDIRPHHCYRVGKHVFNLRALWLPRKARALYFIKRVLQKLRIFAPPNGAAAPTANCKLQTVNLAWDSPCSSQERDFLYEHAADFKPDILIANYPWMIAGVEKTRTASVHWVQTNDYRHRRCLITPEGRFVETLVNPEARAAEQRWLAGADLLIAIQSNEAAAYARAHPGKPVLTACMSVGASLATPGLNGTGCQPSTPDSENNHAAGSGIVAFIGSDHAINQKSALWFVREVWPLVLRHTSHARLRVAGRVCDSLANLDRAERRRVELLGPVPDLAAYYAGATIAIVPILEGSGVKIKLLEAIAHNRPTVTTSVGLDGLEFLRPALAIADTPQKFAAAITRLLTDPARRAAQSAAARALAQSRLAPQTCYAPLLAAARGCLMKNGE